VTQIIYLSVGNLTAPIGGVIVQGEHVAALRRAGFDAKISSAYDGGQPDWINPEAPVLKSGSIEICNGDVVVMHDSLPRHLFDSFLSLPVRKVFFCQNHYFLDGTFAPHEKLSDFAIDAFICVSDPIAEHLRNVHGVHDPVIIRPAVRTAPAVTKTRKLQVCYMPRKRLVECAAVIYGFRYLNSQIADTAFVSIHKMHPDAVAECMSESAIFLSLSAHEGLGLPPLEAMAAGCVVVGYHGGGGLDYATESNGRWYDEETPDNLIHLLADTVGRLRADPDAFSDLLEGGRATAARYSKAAMEDALLKFWRGFL